MASKVKINFQPVKSTDHSVTIIAYINYGYRTIHPNVIRILKKAEVVFPDYKEGMDEIPEHLFKAGWEVMTSELSPSLTKLLQHRKIHVYHPAKVTTGITLPSAFWNKKRKQATGIYSYINARLIEFKDHVETLYNAISDNGTKKIEPEKLSEQVKLHISSKFKEGERILSGKSITASSASNRKKRIELPKVVLPGYYGDRINGIPTNLINYVEWKIEALSKEGYINTGISDDTLAVYKRFTNRVKEYEKSTEETFLKKIEFDIRSVKIDDIKKFVSFFEERGKQDGTKYKWNYLLALKKEFHNLMTKAQSDGIPVSLDLSDKYFSNKWQKQNDPYLTLEHLKMLKKKSFVLTSSEIKKMKDKFGIIVSSHILDNVRDMFVVDCNCGARYSDLKNIKHIYHNEKDGWYFDYVSEKTEIKVKIPVRDKWVIDLYLKKYRKEFKLIAAEQTFNEALKIVCFFAGLKEPINKATKNTRTGKISKDEPPLYSFITSKTGRKTFASNEVKEYHTPLSIVSMWTGHSNEKSLKNYIQLSDEEFYKIAQSTREMLLELQQLRKESLGN